MKIFISGISGTGMGPLALMAKSAGIEVCGSDLAAGAVYDELIAAGIEVFIGGQDGKFLREKLNEGVDWFVHTSALSSDHLELMLAREAGVRISKRDDLTAFLVEKLGLKMVAVAGTHGKTTTTAMIVYTALKMRLPVAYIVGTTLGFAPAGAYHAGDKFLIYEADEYDRNFLKFSPWLAVITTVSYDHPDIYVTEEDYKKAFEQFAGQSENVIVAPEFNADDFKLAGPARRYDAALAATAVTRMAPRISPLEPVAILNHFPGVGRRFEKLADGIFTDYAHHPEEIAATLEVMKDENRLHGKKGTIVVYQPHQNQRQYEVKDGYAAAFCEAAKVYWLPTYLVRGEAEAAARGDGKPVLKPEELYAGIDGAERAEIGDELFAEILKWRDAGYSVILMTAGPADAWLRQKLAKM